MEINEKLNEKIKEWSEGNEYLYSLLYFCWEKSIKTVACCAGHDKHPYPYISIIIDENSFQYLQSIIASMESVENVVLSCDYRHHSNLQFQEDILDSERRTVTIYCQMHNRCEVFFKLACAINGMQKDIKTEKGKSFYESILRFMELSDEEIRNALKAGIVVNSTLSTITEDYRRYKEYKSKEKLYGNAILQLFSKTVRETNAKFQGKYIVQNEFDESPQARI